MGLFKRNRIGLRTDPYVAWDNTDKIFTVQQRYKPADGSTAKAIGHVEV